MCEEFEASEPSSTRTVSSHSLVSSDSTAPLSPDHPLTIVSPTPTPTRVSFHRRTARMAVRTQPTLSPGMSARIAEAVALSPSSFRKRYSSSYETPSPSSSLTLLVRKRYRGTFELILDTDSEGDKLGDEDTKEDESSDADGDRESQGLVDEGQSLDDEGQGLDDEGQGLEDEGPGLGYRAARHRALESTEEIAPNPEDGKVYTNILTYAPPTAPVLTPPSPEWSLGSLPVSPSSLVVSSPIASLVATPATTISVDEDQFLEYLRELYTISGAVRDEIFSQRYRFRSLEREKERATMTFSAIWKPRENHAIRRQLAKERRGQFELKDRVARMERRQESRGD
ncbi:hypothetical protein Tco_1291241 [Tanacetum coccineum]